MSIAELGGDGGGAIVAEWVELDGVRYPLQRPGQIQLRPMAPFAPAGALGDPSRPPLDPRLASITLVGSDMTGGLGVRDLDESQGITTYKRGLLDTRFKNGVTMPPYATLLATLTFLPAPSPGVRVTYAHILGATNYLFVYGANVGSPTMLVVNPTTGAVVATITGANYYDLALFNGYVVATSSVGMRYSTSGTAFSTGDTSSQWRGLAVLDNLLWSFRQDTKQIYSCTDPTQVAGVGGGWVAQGLPLYLRPDEVVVEVRAWRDRNGDPVLYLLTNQRILGLDRVSGNWVEFFDFHARAPGATPSLHVWSRDGQMYQTYNGALTFSNQWVMQFTGNANEVGPTGKGGLDTDLFVGPLFVEGNQHWLFAWFAGDGTGAKPGGVWAMNEFGGWHPIFYPGSFNETGLLIGGGVYGDTVYALFANGHLYAITVPDTALPPYRLSNNTMNGTLPLTTGRTTCGRPNQWKIGQYFYVDCERVDGTHGLPPNATLQVGYALEGATAFTNAGAALTSATAFPAFIPLPDVGQAGVAFRQITAQATLDKTNVADEPPILRELTLYYAPWTQQKYGYVCNLDLRRESWGAGPLPDYDGLTIQNLWDKLFDPTTGLANKKGHIAFAYGAADWAVTVAATDLLAAATTDPGAGGGVVQVTLRDLTLPSG